VLICNDYQLLVTNTQQPPDQFSSQVFNNAGIIGVFENSNSSDERIFLQQIITEDSQNVEVYLFDIDQTSTVNMEIQLTLFDQKNQIDFAKLDPDKGTLAYMSNDEQYFGYYSF